MARCHRRYVATGEVGPGHGGGKKAILMDEHLSYVDEKQRANNELTGPELKKMLSDEFDVEVSSRTITRGRSKLGWKFGNTRYLNI